MRVIFCDKTSSIEKCASRRKLVRDLHNSRGQPFSEKRHKPYEFHAKEFEREERKRDEMGEERGQKKGTREKVKST